MTVMCVMPDIWNRTTGEDVEPLLEVGTEYTVTGLVYHAPSAYYRLLEIGGGNLFNTQCFALMPEKTADEMQELEHEAIIYQR